MGALREAWERLARTLRAWLGSPRLTPEQRIVVERIPEVRRLAPELRARLEALAARFLRDVPIDGILGLAPTEDERLELAGCAALLHAGRPEWPFPRVRKVLISPVALDEEGQPKAGGGLGGYYTGGVITYFRDDLRASFREPRDGYHIVLHELAHAIDAEILDGVPFSLSGEGAERFRALVKRTARATRAGRSPLRPYAAKDDAETFAVAVESFFERPRALRDGHPELYADLARLFRQDPAAADAP